ncbi:hypothetical protein DAETH_38430 (plasmid) [Deinococcus aetherius]|uniref:HTH tetR-type domain-containing protein n=1 Tax=Deinococcus aetherius TaxID=200252 RepID=A0ABM8AJ95_9DEIO|nr:TetR/AcrR family transcriptional regulator [Deinococcus aetherius]BDP43874.1 hypothetical protein DAETH_38430 [Deinococcus aetherius]
MLLERWGYAGMAVEDVARAAGVTKKTLYHHFGSKNALVIALIHLRLDEHGAAVRGILASAPSAREGLEALTLWFAARPPAHDVLRDTARFLPGEDQVVLNQAFLRHVIAPLEEALRRGVEEGEFEPHDTTFAAWMLLGMLSTLPALLVLGHLPSLPGSLMTLLMRGLEQPKTPP